MVLVVLVVIVRLIMPSWVAQEEVVQGTVMLTRLLEQLIKAMQVVMDNLLAGVVLVAVVVLVKLVKMAMVTE